ncbi:MAG: 50S ribosomal protein L15 [Candidatus Omnitrophica bacterium]|nr:50S ribosomal protein L15 [Candidatus Omnitrophota bacterium]MCB9720705.1 50S ribosomal protein L15 [Candidatus Omnitrophota bacterium]
MNLSQLNSPKGSRKRKRIVGRGRGSGRGKTSGRGENGQRSRSGRWCAKASEGGQIRLIRRLPKVGFRSHRPILNQIVHVGSLERFDKDTVVTAELLKQERLISSLNKPFKILGDGELKTALIVQAESVSKSAREKIEKAGGKVEIAAKKEAKEKSKAAS